MAENSIIATALTITGLVPVGGAGNPTPFGFHVYASPIGADIDLSANSSNPGMFSYAGSATGIETSFEAHSGETYAFFYYNYNSAVTGSTLFTFADSISNLQVQTTVYNNPSGTSPNIYYSPSTLTVPASKLSWDADRFAAYMTGVGCVASGPDDHGHNYAWSEDGPDPDSWGNYAPFFDFDLAQRYLLLQSNPANSGYSRWYKYYKVLKDTAGNYYMPDHNPFVLYQVASGSTPPAPSGASIYIDPSASAVTATSVSENAWLTAYASGCDMDVNNFTYLLSGGSFITGITINNAGQNMYMINCSFPTNSGSTDRTAYIDFVFHDTSGYSYTDTGKVTQEPAPAPSVAYIRFVDSAVTMNSTWETYTLEASGCTPIGWGDCAFSATGNVDIFSITQYGYICGIAAEENTGATPLESDVRVEFHDTSGNTYYDTIHVVQAVQTRAYFAPHIINVSSGATTASTTAVGFNCVASSVTFNQITYSGGTWPVEPTFTINGTEVTCQVPENTGNQSRNVEYQFTITDTNGNTYTAQFYIGQAEGKTGWVYLNPTSRTIDYNATSSTLNVYYSGCSIVDTSLSAFTAFTYAVSGNNFITGTSSRTQAASDISNNRARIYVYNSQNESTEPRDIYIGFTFLDTDSHEYHDTYHLVQGGALNMWVKPTNIQVASSATVASASLSALNETLSSFTYTIYDNSKPAYGTIFLSGVTVERVGDDFVFHFGPNGTTSNREARVDLVLTSERGNVYGGSVSLYQYAGDGEKNIYASISDVNVGSGSSSTSGSVYALACTYDHFTYMTGGSVQLTVTTGANNTIYVNAPANNTSNSRVGYVYLTYYDTDGNQYYQTITIRQAAGTGPGPGPQPEPTWNVLTSLTISDNEQHRFFVEAEPGKSYKANGIEYKTVSACEARYSLYYINSYGGVDVMVFKGRSNKKTDNVTRFNYSRSFRNNTLEFENVNYMNEIKATWELQTGWLVDKQSKKMHELVESTCVYLYDAQEQVYIPVVMTDKTLEYKTYKNQNNRFYNYTIKVEESQSRERR